MNKQVVGKLGEDLAAEFLVRLGYQILNRNLRLARYEIDIVALKASHITLIEVKTKASTSGLWQAEELLGAKKYQSLLKAAALYCKQYKAPQTRIKLELVTVSLDRENKAKIRHYIDII